MLLWQLFFCTSQNQSQGESFFTKLKKKPLSPLHLVGASAEVVSHKNFVNLLEELFLVVSSTYHLFYDDRLCSETNKTGLVNKSKHTSGLCLFSGVCAYFLGLCLFSRVVLIF